MKAHGYFLRWKASGWMLVLMLDGKEIKETQYATYDEAMDGGARWEKICRTTQGRPLREALLQRFSRQDDRGAVTQPRAAA